MRIFSTPLICLSLLLPLSGCDVARPPQGQVVARVNDGELTVHQLNQLNPRYSKLDEAQQDVMVERVIDRELLIQQALELRLDRDPQVMLQMEEARRDVLVNALNRYYSSRQPPLQEAEVANYFRQHPGLFAERKRYRLKLLSLPVNDALAAEARQRMDQQQDIETIGKWLQQQGNPVRVQMLELMAEQLPIEAVEHLRQAELGQSVAFTSPSTLALYQLIESEPMPLQWQQAQPLIETYLRKQQQNRFIRDQLQRLRAAARIQRAEVLVKG